MLLWNAKWIKTMVRLFTVVMICNFAVCTFAGCGGKEEGGEEKQEA